MSESAVETGNLNKQITGNVESFSGGCISGWVFFADDEVSKRVSPRKVCVYEENKLIGSGYAENYREDLEVAGFGNCAFSIELDESVFDGRKHSLTVFDDLSGELLGSKDIHTEKIDDQSSVLSSCQEHFENQRFENALSLSIQAQKKWGHFLPIDRVRADSYFKLGNFDRAIQAYNEILSSTKDAPYWVHLGLGNSYEYTKEKSKSHEHLLIALNKKYTKKLAFRLIENSDYKPEKEFYSAIVNSIISVEAEYESLNDIFILCDKLISKERYDEAFLITEHFASQRINNLILVKKVSESFENAGQKKYIIKLNKIVKNSYPGILQLDEKYGTDQKDALPIVSVLVPNYNHGKFLAERIDSILNQSYQSIELIILDDCSSDNSVAVIKEYKKKYPEKIQYVLNESNSGNVFRQWKKGFELCKGRFIWICESDDTAETDFLEKMLPAFEDDAVNIAFSRIQFIDETGEEFAGLDNYRENAEPNVWNSFRKGPACAWFSGAFAVHNIIPNVGGCLIKNQTVEDDIWEKAQEFSVLGDWYLYLKLARGGKIAYEPDTTTYFRQHSRNTSVSSFVNPEYYHEHEKVAVAINEQWKVTPDSTWRFYKQVKAQFIRNKFDDSTLNEHFSLDKILDTEVSVPHIMIGFWGFYVGGGEYFPIHLANALAKLNCNVSMLVLDTMNWNQKMVDLLDAKIPIYSANDLRNMGVSEFIKQTGVNLINSHHIGVEGLFFLEQASELEIPYVSTLHGTYEVSDISQYQISKIARSVDHWIYTADKNLNHINTRKWLTSDKTKLPNATPLTTDILPFNRGTLGITDSTFVYTLISRPQEDKGWEDAIKAYKAIQSVNSDTALLLVGAGDYADELNEKYGEIPNLFFLGYQSNVHGIFELSDCCILPTRFPGESYPLILVQALQAGLPCISTTIGEIESILDHDGQLAGVLFDHSDEDLFSDNLTDSMRMMLDRNSYDGFAKTAKEIGSTISIDNLANDYLSLYRELIRAEDDKRCREAISSKKNNKSAAA